MVVDITLQYVSTMRYAMAYFAAITVMLKMSGNLKMVVPDG